MSRLELHCAPVLTTGYSANQRLLLDNALMVVHRVPSSTSPGSAQLVEEISWKNTWNWCVTFLPSSLRWS